MAPVADPCIAHARGAILYETARVDDFTIQTTRHLAAEGINLCVGYKYELLNDCGKKIST